MDRLQETLDTYALAKKPKSLIKKLRELPYEGEILVSPGDLVEPHTVVARINYVPGRLVRHDVAQEIAVNPKDMEKHLTVSLGQMVEEGETLAVAGDFFAGRTSKSTVEGVVAMVSRYLGRIYLRVPMDLGTNERTEIEVAKPLGVSPFLIKNYLTVNEGKFVFTGQTIAKKVTEGKWKIVTSPLYGRVEKVSREKGTVVIAPIFKTTDVHAYVKGIVSRVIPGKGVEIASFAHVVHGVFGIGGQSWGPIRVVEGNLSKRSDLSGAVVVMRGTVRPEDLEVLNEVGAKGLVAGSISLTTLNGYAVQPFNPALTGNEDVPYPVIVTEGFMSTEMDRGTWQVFEQLEGMLASLSGATHIRAGVIRPEVIIPCGYPENIHKQEHDAESEKKSVCIATDVSPGKAVKVVRGPYFGAVGVVLESSFETVRIETGASAELCTVRLYDGSVIRVPRANIAHYHQRVDAALELSKNADKNLKSGEYN